MEKGSTREQILAVALDLFSVNGFEATSTAQLAEAVGLRKASLYSHFENKQAILDALVEALTAEYEQHSLFARADWNDPDFTRPLKNRPVEEIMAGIRGQIAYIIHDPRISKARKMLTIEQFRNEELKNIHAKRSYEDILRYHEGMVRFLIGEGILKDGDVSIMAAQLAWPISILVYLCDREPEREAEALAFADRHVRQFFTIYGT